MPQLRRITAADVAEGSISGMHPDNDGNVELLRDDLMAGKGNFNQGFDAAGNPSSFTLGQPARAVARNIYGGVGAGERTKQNDAPLDIQVTSDVFNRPFIDGEPTPQFSETKSELPKPLAPILKKMAATTAGFSASTAASPYWITYSWGISAGASIQHTPLAPPTLVPPLAQGQSMLAEIPENAQEGATHLGLWLTEPGTSTVTTPGTFRLQKTIELAQFPARQVPLDGPFDHSAQSGTTTSSTSSGNDTAVSPPGRPGLQMSDGRNDWISDGWARPLENGAFFVATYATRQGETLPSEHAPRDAAGIHDSYNFIIDNMRVNDDFRDIYLANTDDPRVIGWYVYLFLNGKWYRHYDPITGYGKTKPFPNAGPKYEWEILTTGQLEGNENFIPSSWNVGQKHGRFLSRTVFIYESEPPGENQSGLVAPEDPLATPTVFGAARPGPGHYAFQVTEVDEDGRESEPSDTSEIDITENDVIRIVFANRTNRIPNATLIERGADGLPLDFTFVQTNGSVTLDAGEMVFKTTGAQTGTTPSGISDPVEIDRTKDWSVGALLDIQNPETGAFAGSFEAVLRELDSSGAATDTVLKNGAAVGEHAFYQVVSHAGGSAPAWASTTVQAQILYRFSGGTKNAVVKVSRQILKDYIYRFRRRQEPLAGADEASNPNPPPQQTAVPSGSTAVEPSPTPESVPETLTQTAPDRPSLSGTTLQSGDLESAMPTGFSQTTSGTGALTRETTPAITPLVGSYSLRSRKASGGSLSSAFLSKIYGSRSTTLSGAMTNSQTTVPMTDLSYWPPTGTVYVDTEKITYTGKSALNGAGNLTGCSRGAYGSSAATHSSGATASLLGRDAISLYAKRQLPTLPTNGYVTLGELRRWTDGVRFAWLDIDSRNETAQLTVNNGPSVAGNITTTLDNVSTNIALAAVAEQSRLTFTSGVTQPGGTPYTGTSIVRLGGVNYTVPVYGGGQTAQFDVQILTGAAGTGYFLASLPDSAGRGVDIKVNVVSGDSASTVASKISAAINAAASSQPTLEWWTSSYTSGDTFRITANSNGERSSVGFRAGTVNNPSPNATTVRLGTASPRPQTERFQILGNYSSVSDTFFTIFLGTARSQMRGYSFSSLTYGDTPQVAAKKIYDEFRTKFQGFSWSDEWKASYTPGSDTVFFTQSIARTVPSATVSVPSNMTLPNSISTLYAGANNDTATDVATRVRNTIYSGWTTGNSAAVVDFFAKDAGLKTDISFTGAGGVAATASTPVQGSADTPAQVASKVVTAYAGNPSWTVTSATNVVTFVATSTGNKQDATFSPGSTGVVADMTTTVQGTIDIVASAYDPATGLPRKRRVQTGITTSTIPNTEISVQGAGTSNGIVEVWGSTGSSTMTLLGWFEGLDLTDYPAGEVAVGGVAESSSALTWDVITDSIEVTDRGKTYYETHDYSGNLINQVHGHYLPTQLKSQHLLLQDYRRSVIPGWQYTVAGKIRYDGASGAVPFYLTLHNLAGHEYPLRDVATGVSGTGSWQALIDTGITGSSAGAWQEFTCTFTVPIDPKCYELRLRSKDISSGEFIIQSLVVSPGSAPLRTTHFATVGNYVATLDMGNPAIPPNAFWTKQRTALRMTAAPVDNVNLAPGWSSDITFRSAPVLAGPYSSWVADPDTVPDASIIQASWVVGSDGLSSPVLPSGAPTLEYALIHPTGAPLRTFLKGNRAELPGGAALAKLMRPQQLKDVAVTRRPGERYDRVPTSARTGRQREFELIVFTPDAADYVTNEWADTTFALEGFGQWWEIRLSSEPDFEAQVAERMRDGQVYGVYATKLSRAEIVQQGILAGDLLPAPLGAPLGT